MKANCILTDLRATMFASPILYNAANLKKVTDLFDPADGYVPTTLGFPFTPGLGAQLPQQGQNLEWEMLSQTKSIRIHFGPQKIDILKLVIEGVEGQEIAFCNESTDIFTMIVEAFNLVPIRLAFAPTYNANFTNDFTISDFNDSLYAKKTFEGTSVNNCLFKQSYRLGETLNSRQVPFNYVMDGANGQQFIPKEATTEIHSIISFGLDINTVQGIGLTFSLSDLKAFFLASPLYSEKFLNFYIND